ncbi:MAG: type IX secretion system membrane protein PorP/SprF [Bacteroidia bacterium]|nr:type IX secretion system membrane protein PorP/SprF [Bacteroidia bacterium]
MRRLLIIVLASVYGCLYGQQEGLLSQFMYNGALLNPAAAGSQPYWTASATYRKQWLNFDGTPSTQFLSVEGPWKGKKIGLGGSVINDVIGVSRRTDVDAFYSYHLLIGKGYLSMGLRGGISHYSSRLTELTVWDAGDANFGADVRGKIIPNAGTGVYFYLDNFTAGFSVPNLLSHKSGTPISIALSNIPQYQRHYYLHSTGKIKAGEKFFVKPALVFRYVDGAPAQCEVHIAGSYRDLADLGVSYRTGDGLIFITQMNIMKKLRLGYSFDLPLSGLSGYTNGTHEVRLAWLFGEAADKLGVPSFMGN